MPNMHNHGRSAAPLTGHNYSKTQLRPMIAEYNPKNQGVRTELSELVMVKYKCDKNDVPITTVAGSTLPLVEMPTREDEEEGDYNPFEHRKLSHPTTDMDTFIHLLKGSLGSGILAMPLAFKNAGLWFGLVATFVVGAICTYCVHILVKCAHTLCRRTQIPALGFAEVAETAFLAGPEVLHKYSRLARATINLFLVLDLLGCCCVYVVFVSSNIKQVVDPLTDTNYDVRLYMVMLLPFLLVMNLIRNLKWLAPFSMIANVLMATGISITLYYIITGLQVEVQERPAFADFSGLPMFFGTVIFALEGIGVVMPLENNMKTPTHFIGCPGVLNFGMFFVVLLYAIVGFLGYLNYGDATLGSITLNLPPKDVLAQSVNIMIAVAIFLTFSLQFYVPMEIMWKNFKQYFGAHQRAAEYGMRVFFVCLCVAIAAAIPNLGPFISLIGAVCLSTLGLMFPAIIEMVTYWERPGMGRYNWRIWKNSCLILFGVLGFVTGTYVSINAIITGESSH